MPDSDASLLKSFAATRDEKTFRVLADRYLGLIFHTAVRRTGNRPLSEEVSQNVLCAMAKKAGGLAKNPERLAAWLHRATILESLKAMRSEASHQRRKQRPHPDDAAAAHPAESIWSDAVPILDGALNKLSEADRTVLLLHFFENQTFPQIARGLGKSAEAVQKQSRRALEKLSRLLRARGVALSATALVTGLTAEMAKAAPASLCATAAANAFSAAGSSSSSITLLLSMKPKVLIPATLLVCALPLAIQQTAISLAEARNAGLQSRFQDPSSNSRLTANHRVRPTNPKSGTSSKADFIALAYQWDETRRTLGGSRWSGGVYPDLARYFKSFEALDNDALIRLIRDGMAAEIDQAKRYPTIRTLLTTLSERDPELALETAIEAFPSGAAFSAAVGKTGLGSILGDWASKDPAAAWKWFCENRSSGKIANMSASTGFPGGFHIAIPSTNQSPPVPTAFLQPLANALIDSSLPLARELMEIIPMGQRGEFLQTLHSISIVNSMSAISSKNLPAPVSAHTTLQRSASLLILTREFAPMSMEQVLPVILNGAAGGFGDRSSIDAFLERAQLTENEKIIAARHFARGSQDRNRVTVSGSFSEMNDKRYTDQLDLTKELAPTLSDQLVAEAHAEKRNMDAKMAKAQIEKLQSWKNITDERLIQTLTRYDFSSQIDAAIKQAERISDSEKREQIIKQLWQSP